MSLFHSMGFFRNRLLCKGSTLIWTSLDVIVKYSDHIHGFTEILENRAKENEPNLVNQHKYKTEQLALYNWAGPASWAWVLSFLNCLKPAERREL
jgi:hypothetical protein